MSCRRYRHTTKAYRREETVWSVAGRPAGLNLTIFEYPKSLCALFTGYRGDSMWRRELQDRGEPFRAGTIAGLGVAEFRLHEGIFHCDVAFLGSCKAQQIQDITYSDEMAPWTLGGSYDRPIPRRILEEAGVSRETFGMRKNATTAPLSLYWPFSHAAAESFRRYLRKRGLRAPGAATVWLLRRLRFLDQFVIVNLNHLLGTRWKGLRKYLRDPGRDLIFQWANGVLKLRYQEGLRSAGYAERDEASESPQKTNV